MMAHVTLVDDDGQWMVHWFGVEVDVDATGSPAGVESLWVQVGGGTLRGRDAPDATKRASTSSIAKGNGLILRLALCNPQNSTRNQRDDMIVWQSHR